MMKIPKPTQADMDRFREIVPEYPEVDIKPMFGNLGAFVNGNMFMGLFGSAIGVKLDVSDRDALVALGGGSFGPAERPMSGYVTLPASWAPESEQVDEWVMTALTYVSAMPAKVTKANVTKANVTKANVTKANVTKVANGVKATRGPGIPKAT
jgi:TfoX/Sxy family transcriptional regulator of competence genes